MKMEGGYNGNHDWGEISLSPTQRYAGPMEEPNAIPADKGIALSTVADTIAVPFNEPEIARQLIKKHRDEAAAVILEPMLGGLGMIPPKPDYLRQLRDITDENDVLLIFDEVVTLRLASGGMQEIFDVKPDLTALGKIIGGGLPVGAFGGRKEIMQQFNPELPGFMWHASTFSGNPLTMHLHLAMIQRGIFPASRQMYCISTPMSEREVDAAADALLDALKDLKPAIEKDFRRLLV